MKHSKKIRVTGDAKEALGLPRGFEYNQAGNIYWDACNKLASARAIMQKFVDKVDRGMARSADGWIVRCDTETYAEMKQWMEDE